MINWMPVITEVAVGGGAGVADQYVQNWDEKRKRTDPTLSRFKEGGTYLNYGVPILAVLGMAFGFLKEPWASRAILVGSQLAGRKATYTLTKAAQSAPYTPVPNYRPVPQTQSRPVGRTYQPEFESVAPHAF